MMKRYAFELSGEHETLPKSEALALVEAFSTSFSEIEYPQHLEQCLIVEAESLDATVIAERLSMSHRIIQVLAVCDADLESLAHSARTIELPPRRYMIRARRIRDSSPQADLVERTVGSELFKRGYRADLSDPEIVLRAIITSGKIVLGIEAARADRSSFEARRPHLKPFFHPGVLMPRMARALVNLTQVRAGEILLDPFAGTCGILIEGSLIGAVCVGIEVQKRLARGALCNIDGLDCSLLLGDAKHLPIRDSSIDASVLDTPYGRSAKILAESKDILLKESLAELFRTIKPGRRMVIVSDCSIEASLEDAGFHILQKHTDRVHRSLTRQIFLCRR